VSLIRPQAAINRERCAAVLAAALADAPAQRAATAQRAEYEEAVRQYLQVRLSVVSVYDLLRMSARNQAQRSALLAGRTGVLGTLSRPPAGHSSSAPACLRLARSARPT
jgi:hypothetical protein